MWESDINCKGTLYKALCNISSSLSSKVFLYLIIIKSTNKGNLFDFDFSKNLKSYGFWAPIISLGKGINPNLVKIRICNKVCNNNNIDK